MKQGRLLHMIHETFSNISLKKRQFFEKPKFTNINDGSRNVSYE